MRLQDDIDFTTLTWVKAELDETLKQARHALEAFVEDPTDASQMRFCATYLHQVQGTLRMVELYGAAMVTEEMEHLATALLNDQVKERDEAYTVLMRGIVQLPDYLERLQTGYKDIPIVLLPLLNELRAARGEKGLSEAVLFTPDLGRSLPKSAAGPAQPVAEAELRRQAEQLRMQFQLSLLKWFRNEDPATHVTRLAQVCDRLVAAVSQEDARRLFWVAAGLLTALRENAFAPSPQLKQAIGKIEREIKRLADLGESVFRLEPPRELTRNLLYFAAHAPTQHGRIGELRQVFELERLLPTEEELRHAQGSISGHNRALLDTVSAAIKEDLLRVKDALDLFMRTQSTDVGSLAQQAEVLDRVADTLGMLGLGVPRGVVLEQRQAVQQVADRTRPADEATLLDIAGALLYVESSLDDQVQHLGAAAPGKGRDLPQAEARKVLDALIKEAQSNFAQAKQCFVAFVESNWDHHQLEDVPRLLEEVSGALRILELDEPPRYLMAVRRFTEAELLGRHRVPNGQQLDTLADALASLEYYLEALREHRAGREKILEVARQRLEALGYWPIPEAGAASVIDEVPVAAPEHLVPVAEAMAPVAQPPAAETLPVEAASALPEPIAVAAPEPSAAMATEPEPPPASEEPVSELSAPAPEPVQPMAEASMPVPSGAPVIDATPAIANPAAAPVAPVASAPAAPVFSVGFEGAGEEIDEEIREVFIEEVQEEISNLDELRPAWSAAPESTEALKPIRRVFHTLKGSGRLVGALTLGEFSWKIENMLNRVLDQTIPPSPAVVEVVAAAHRVLPDLLDALRGSGVLHWDLERIKALADRVAGGEQVDVDEIRAATEPMTVAGVAESASIVDAPSVAVVVDHPITEAPAVSDVAPAVASAIESEIGIEPITVAEGELESVLEPMTSFEPASYAAPSELAAEPPPDFEPMPDVLEAQDALEAAVALDAAATAPADVAVAAAPEPEVAYTPGTPFSIDPVLFDILKAEVAGHLETVDAFLAACRVQPQSVTDPLLRAVHTMSGAFAMTEVPHITDVVGPLEGYIKRLLAHRQLPTMTGIGQIAEAADAIRILMRALEAEPPYAPQFTALAERLHALRDTLPEPTGPLLPLHAEVDDEETVAAVAAETTTASVEPALAEGVAEPLVSSEPEPVVSVESLVEAEAPPQAEPALETALAQEPAQLPELEPLPSAETIATEDEIVLEHEAAPVEAMPFDALADEAQAIEPSIAAVAEEPALAEPAFAEVPAEPILSSEPQPALSAEPLAEAEVSPQAEPAMEATLAAEPVSLPELEPLLSAEDEIVLESEPSPVDAMPLDAPDSQVPATEPSMDLLAESAMLETPSAFATLDATTDEAADALAGIQVADLGMGLDYDEIARAVDALPSDEIRVEAIEVESAGDDASVQTISFDAAAPSASEAPEDGEIAEFAEFVEAPAEEPAEAGDAVAADVAAEAAAEPAPVDAAAATLEFGADRGEHVATPDSGGIPAEEFEELSLDSFAAFEDAVLDDLELVEHEPVDFEAEQVAEPTVAAASAEDLHPHDAETASLVELLLSEPAAAEPIEAMSSEEPADAADETAAVADDIDASDAFDSAAAAASIGPIADETGAEADALEAAAGDVEIVGVADVDAVEALEPEAVEVETVEAEAVEPEPIAAESLDVASAAPEPVEAEPVEAQAVEATPVEAETVEAQPIDEHAISPAVEEEAVEIQPIEPTAEAAEPAAVPTDDVVAADTHAAGAAVPDEALADAEDIEAAELAKVPPVTSSDLAEMAAAIESEPPPVPVAAASARHSPLAAIASADPDPDGPLQLPDMDEELLDIFLEEGVDILDHSDGLLAKLRENPGERELVVGLQRDLHTLKGGARMAGLAPIGDLGHAAESLLEAVADGRRELGPAGMELLERVFDRLHGMVKRVGERRALATPQMLLGCVEALVRGEALPGATVAEPVAEAPAESATPVLEAAVAAPAAPSQPMAPQRQREVAPRPTALDAVDDDDTAVRAPQEQIRIRADLLDRLVNYAGEVAIYRARLEQQLGGFRGGLVEMEQTTARLREQLRRLEIETEAQIIARYQREQDENEAKFDPLELDRFSTLQQLSRALAESAADLTSLQTTLDDLTRQYETLLLQQSRVSSELQEGLMRTRMVPFDALVPRLRRILRQTASELGKKAQLKVEGTQGEMDRNVLDRMTAPLEHMLRNALAHGLEPPAERAAKGKPEEGTVRIHVSREASEVVIRVSDDGKGLDRDAIRRKAIERGLLDPNAQLSDRDLYGFILESGFSTAQTISKIAGRGVGMDVVHSEIKQLGDSLHIESEFGKGSEFVIRLPFTLAVTQAVFVKLGETHYAIPITSVQGVARIAPKALDEQLASGSPQFEYAGEQYAIYDLGLLLGQAHARATESLQVPLLLARSGDLRAAICVDQVVGSKEIVVKPTGPQINSIPGIFGATVMGDGSVVVILDVAPLVRRAAAHRLSGEAPAPVQIVEERRVPLVMVVDDSITMRKVTGRVLERAGYEVLAAKDGVDAIEKMQERVPDAMLLDIEMPRMDGYELATHMRNDVRLRNVPIIMITSRTGEKHRQRAFEIGVDRYLGKPYQEPELMRNVQEVLKVGRGG